MAVFQGIAGLYADIDLTRAKSGDYLFFDAAGAPLSLAPAGTGSGTVRYALWGKRGSRRSTLISSLLLARSIRGIPGMETLEAIEDHISRQVNRE